MERWVTSSGIALTYNLLSVSKAAESGNVTNFDANGCQILNKNQRVIAKAIKCGSLYYLDCEESIQANVAQQESKEMVWHRRYGQWLARDNLVKSNPSKDIDFCEACIDGKHMKTPFPVNGCRRAAKLLDLVHSDVCGKLRVKSLSGAEYFLTFINDNSTLYSWVHVHMQGRSV